MKKTRYLYFLIRCWLQILTTNEGSSYYKVYGGKWSMMRTMYKIFETLRRQKYSQVFLISFDEFL